MFDFSSYASTVYFNLLKQKKKKDDKFTLQEKGTANKKLTKFLISKIIACINWWTTFLFINLTKHYDSFANHFCDSIFHKTKGKLRVHM